MDFPTREIYTIDIVLTSIMTIESISISPTSNIDSFTVQFHISHRYYLEISSVIPSKGKWPRQCTSKFYKNTSSWNRRWKSTETCVI